MRPWQVLQQGRCGSQVDVFLGGDATAVGREAPTGRVVSRTEIGNRGIGPLLAQRIQPLSVSQRSALARKGTPWAKFRNGRSGGLRGLLNLARPARRDYRKSQEQGAGHQQQRAGFGRDRRNAAEETIGFVIQPGGEVQSLAAKTGAVIAEGESPQTVILKRYAVLVFE